MISRFYSNQVKGEIAIGLEEDDPVEQPRYGGNRRRRRKNRQASAQSWQGLLQIQGQEELLAQGVSAAGHLRDLFASNRRYVHEFDYDISLVGSWCCYEPGRASSRWW